MNIEETIESIATHITESASQRDIEQAFYEDQVYYFESMGGEDLEEYIKDHELEHLIIR